MPGIRGLRVEVVPEVSALGAEWDPLFACGAGLQSTRAWFEATEAAALPQGATARYVVMRASGAPAALVPLKAGPGQGLSSLTSPYTVLYQPLMAPGLSPDAIRDVGAAFGRHCRGAGLVVLEALDPGWPGFAPFCGSLARGGMRARRFEHFGNWHEAVAGVSWDGYLASRPGQLRETIRRKTRAAARNACVRLEVVQDSAGIGPALAAYEDIYARSWKQPEPFPLFNAALLHRLAAVGAARMGVLWSGDRPVAAQYWTVWNGVGTVLKLAHDDAQKTLSPGTVLTAHMIRHLMERDRVGELDFGRGDDDYKKLWAGTRRQRVGLVIANPWRRRGLVALMRQDIGGLRKWLARR